MTHPQVDADSFAEIARSLAGQDGLDATLQRIVELATQIVPGTQHAAISLIRAHRQVQTVAPTGALARRVDQIQYDAGEGPCLDAIWAHEVVRIDDLSSTGRWPGFASRAAQAGVLSMLAFRLFVEGDTAGALNLYSGERHAFDERSVHLGHVLAAHAGLAYDHAHELAGLREANESRTVIGQAQGILMAQHRIDADQAFALLTRLSQNRNRKLRDVAGDVIAQVTAPGRSTSAKPTSTGRNGVG